MFKVNTVMVRYFGKANSTQQQENIYSRIVFTRFIYYFKIIELFFFNKIEFH